MVEGEVVLRKGSITFVSEVVGHHIAGRPTRILFVQGCAGGPSRTQIYDAILIGAVEFGELLGEYIERFTLEK